MLRSRRMSPADHLPAFSDRPERHFCKQDIRKGSGELAYYDRSHRLPHYIFSNGKKHSDGNTPDYPRDIEAACSERTGAAGPF